jgi:hypothetical protein
MDGLGRIGCDEICYIFRIANVAEFRFSGYRGSAGAKVGYRGPSERFAARLKPCPDTKPPTSGFRLTISRRSQFLGSMV